MKIASCLLRRVVVPSAIYCVVFLIVFATTLYSKTVLTQSSGASNGTALKAGDLLGRIPLRFERNVGQMPGAGNAQYVGRAPGYMVGLDQRGVTVQFAGSARGDGKQSLDALAMQFLGARPDAKMRVEQPLGIIDSYFAGPESNWRGGVSTWGRVTYQSIYPGVDLSFYGNEGRLEFDYVVSPYADPLAVRFSMQGTSRGELQANGDLRLTAGSRALELLRPVAFQVGDDGARKPVSVAYRLSSGGELSFQVGQYDRSRTLVIDPILAYATYLPAGWAVDVAADAGGNIYVLMSNNYWGGAATDVLKFGPAGSLVWDATIANSTGTNYPSALRVDSSGRALVAGSATAGYPTTANAYQTANPQPPTSGWTSPTLSVVKADGTNLVYSTYFGGSGNDQDFGLSLAVDAAGNAYLGGNAGSTGFPTTAGSYQPSYLPNNTRAGFLAKFNPSLSGKSSLVYSTLLGIYGTAVNGIAVDTSGNAFLALYSPSGAFAITVGAFAYVGVQSASGAGAYAVKMNPAATALAYSAYLGSGVPTAIAIDTSGDAYVAGAVGVEDFPTTLGAYQTIYPDGFVTEVSPSGAALIYSTFLSGPSGETAGQRVRPGSIAVQPGCASSCVAWVSGNTSASDFPAINAIQSSAPTLNSAFFVELAADGKSALSSSYLGGLNSYSYPYGGGAVTAEHLTIDTPGNVWMVGNINSGTFDFPVTVNGSSSTTGGFLAEIVNSGGPWIIAVPNSVSFGPVPVGVDWVSYRVLPPMTVALRNMGTATAILQPFVFNPSNGFSETDDCNGQIAAGGFCTLNMNYTPTNDMAQASTLQITPAGSNQTVSVALTGTGSDQGWLTLTPAGLDFGIQGIGTTSAAKTLTLTNMGNQPQPIYGISTGAPFSLLDDCPDTLPVGASCHIAVQFAPTQIGYYANSVYVSSPNSYPQVSATGSGTATTASGGTFGWALSATALNFDTQPIGTQSAWQTVWITNVGSLPFTLSAYPVALTSASGSAKDFVVQGGTCGNQQLGPQGTCWFLVAFAPSVAGVETANVSVKFAETTTAATIAVSGIGSTTSRQLEATPFNQVFPDQPIGVPSAVQWFYIFNVGNLPVTISRMTLTGDFQVSTQNCTGYPLNPPTAPGYDNSYCWIGVIFKPTDVGTRNGTLTLFDAATDNPQTFNLTGDGITATGSVMVNPQKLMFPATPTGTTSADEWMQVLNPGNSAITINSITTSAEYALTYDGCPARPFRMDAGGYCSMRVGFTPTSTTNPRAGTLTVSSTAGNAKTDLTGTGVTATTAVGVTPTSINFGTFQSGVQTNPITVYVRNTGTKPVTFPNKASITGNFQLTLDYCSSDTTTQLLPGWECMMQVAFTPVGTGAQTGALSILTTASATAMKVTLTGTGASTYPAVYFTPPMLTFAEQPVNTPSYQQTTYMYYTGANSLGISTAKITAGGSNFLIPSGGDYCTGQTISSGGYCSVGVEFLPTVAGYATGTLTITDASSKTYTVSLAGYAPTIVDAGYLNPAALNFANQVVGVASGDQSINLYNSGSEPMTVGTVTGTNIGATGEFITDWETCTGQVIPPLSGSCSVGFHFLPTMSGARTGSVTIPVTYADNTTGSFTAELTGNGLGTKDDASLTPTVVTFTDQVVGHANSYGSPQQLVLTNTGNRPLTVGRLSGTNLIIGTVTTGDFTTSVVTGVSSGSDGCSNQPVSPQGSCSVNVMFNPQTAGAKTGSIVFPVFYSGATTATNYTASLSGTGIAPKSSVLITPAKGQFGKQVVSTVSTGQQSIQVTFSNNGNVPVKLGKATINAPFQLNSDGCSSQTIAMATDCNITIQFAPTATGAATGTLSIPDDATGNPHTAVFTGTGIAATEQLVFSQTTVPLPPVVVGSGGNWQQIYLTNQSNAPVTINSLTMGGTNPTDFKESDNCTGYAMGGNQQCTINVWFTPGATSSGARSATLTETDSGAGGPRSVTLTSTGLQAVPTVTLYPSSLTFAKTNVGVVTQSQAFSVNNTGNADLSITAVTSSNATEFAIASDGCSGHTVSSKSSCLVTVTFAPTLGGSRSSTISVKDNASGSPQTLKATGTGYGIPQSTLDSLVLDFGNQNLSTTSAAKTVKVTNGGTDTLNIASIALTGVNSGDFGKSSTCASTLAPTTSCTVLVTFAPTVAGARSASLVITHNANNVAGSAQTVTLNGTGVGVPTAGLDFTSLTFQAQNVGTTSAAQSVKLTNSGSDVLTIASVVKGGTNAADFAMTNGCGTTLAINASCSVSFTFTPQDGGSRTATVTITDNSGNVAGTTQVVNITGTGVPPATAPTFNPPGGTYNSAQSVTISSTTPGAAIYYTTNGSTPTASSTKYVGAVTVSSSQTLKAIAVAAGYADSPVGSATYKLQVAAPTFTPVTGTYNSAQTVTISTTTAGAAIYYTTDGTTPSGSSTKYTGPVTVSKTQTLKAYGVLSGYTSSTVTSGIYTLQVATPTFSPAGGMYGSTQNVTISSTTQGAAIYYTTDGTTPTSSSTLFTAPVAVSKSQTLKAIGVLTGFSNSAVGSASYTMQAATPTFNPPGGTYNSTQTVTISTTTQGATIYYTTDGTTPTTASAVYSAPVSVISSGKTLKAIAAMSGFANSPVGSASYTLQVATPTFNPSGGTYGAPQTVTISSITSNANIYYTLDGTTPTASSTLYMGPVTVSSSKTLKAFAMSAGFLSSAVASASYSFQAAAPTFSPVGGTYNTAQTVTLSSVTPGAVIYCTTNGTTPTTASTKYVGAVTVSTSQTIKAIAVAAGFTNSVVSSAAYVMQAGTPTFTPAAGSYGNIQNVTINTVTPNATIYYTIDGTTPTTASPVYSSAVKVDKSMTINAIATATGFTQSQVGTAAYTMVATAPSFSPIAGNYTTTQSVSISDTTPGAIIYYTTNGSTPTTSSTKFTGAISIAKTTTLKAFAAAPGYAQSAVATATYSMSSATVSSSTLAFGNQPVGVQSAPLPVVVTNTSSFPIAVNSVSLGGSTYFAQTNNCSSLGAGLTCTINVTCTPQAVSSYSATLTINLAIPTTPLKVNLTGSGMLSTLKVVPTWLDFGNQTVGVTSAQGNLNLVAGPTASSMVTVSSASFSGANASDFAVAPGACVGSAFNKCMMGITFKPSGMGLRVANLVLTDSAAGSPHSIPLRGSGVAVIAGIPKISTYAGNGINAYGGDNAVATNAWLSGPQSVIADANGNLYIADAQNNVVRLVTKSTGVISTYAGVAGAGGFGGDGAAATTGLLSFPFALALDSAGNLYIADAGNAVVRKVAASTKVMTTVAGLHSNMCNSVSGDGAAATSASLCMPAGVAVDAVGNLYVSDMVTSTIRKVDAGTGLISTIAGSNWNLGFGGDGGPATSALLAYPGNLILDTKGNLFFVDGSAEVRRIALSTGVISAVAGRGGIFGSSGDGGQATNATFESPSGLAMDASGNLYIADAMNQSIRTVNMTTGIISTIAGIGTAGYTGDGGAATAAQLNFPSGIAFDTSGNLFIADSNNNVIRKLGALSGTAATPVMNPAGGRYAAAQSVTITDSMRPAVIYYTTDGNTPTTSSTQYSGPILVSSSKTLKAIAVVPGYAQSATATAVYTIGLAARP